MHFITRMDMGGSAQNTLVSCWGLADKYNLTLGFGPTTESRMSPEEQRVVSDRLNEASKNGVLTVVVRSLFRRIAPLHDLLALHQMWQLIRQDRPAIVHTHSSKAGLLGRLAAWMAKVPIIIHTPHGHVFYGHFGKISSNVFLSVERVMDRITDITVALTQEERDDYIRLNVSHAQKLRRVHSGVDIDRFQNLSTDTRAIRKSFGYSSVDKVVAMIGWLLPIKGPDIFLAAIEEVWDKHPETKLLFVGYGDMEAGLRQRLAQTGKTDQAHFAGWRDDIPEILQAIDILVMPSRNEGMGRVAVEAMAAGKPVIASRVGGLKDMVEHGHNGLLFPAGDSHALAQAIIYLLDDPKKAEEFGKAGLRRCLKYSSDRMIEKLDVLYSEQLNAHGLIDAENKSAEDRT